MIEETLALYRLTRLVTRDELTRPPREAAQRWALDNRHPALHYLLSCPHCMSVWLAPLVLLAPRRLRRALAVAGAVSVLVDVLEGGPTLP